MTERKGWRDSRVDDRKVGIQKSWRAGKWPMLSLEWGGGQTIGADRSVDDQVAADVISGVGGEGRL